MPSFQPVYQAFYCEENIWKLAQEPVFQSPSMVCFLSNLQKSCAVWYQKASASPEEPIFWDYHVIFVSSTPEGWEIWDLDSTLGFPQKATTYLEKTFWGSPYLPRDFQPLFRLIPTEVFLATFASDRSHMLRSDGSYTQPPPPWDAPCLPGQEPNLLRFVDLRDPFVGEILDLPEIARRLNGTKRTR